MIVGGGQDATVTVTNCSVSQSPVVLRAVSRYVVVTFGLTIMLPLLATGLPLSKTCAAFDVFHCRVLLWPLSIELGLAKNEFIDGAEQDVAVTVA